MRLVSQGDHNEETHGKLVESWQPQSLCWDSTIAFQCTYQCMFLLNDFYLTTSTQPRGPCFFSDPWPVNIHFFFLFVFPHHQYNMGFSSSTMLFWRKAFSEIYPVWTFLHKAKQYFFLIYYLLISSSVCRAYYYAWSPLTVDNTVFCLCLLVSHRLYSRKEKCRGVDHLSAGANIGELDVILKFKPYGGLD